MKRILREKQLREKLDKMFGTSMVSFEFKEAIIKANLDELTEQDIREYQEEKERELNEFKAMLGPAGDLALPVEGYSVQGFKSLECIENDDPIRGTTGIYERREDDGSQGATAVNQEQCGHSVKRVSEKLYSV
jgi:hypothetical protein